MHAYTCIRTHVHTHIHIDTHIDIHTHTYIRIHIHIQTYIHTSARIQIHTHTYTHTDILTHIYTHMHLICMRTPAYIYIHCHPQIDCFVVSQLFSVAIHVGRLKLGSKRYVKRRIRPLSQQANHVGLGIIRYYVATAAAAAFLCLHFIPYRILECSIRSKSFGLCERQPKIPSAECSTSMGERISCPSGGVGKYIYIYIYIYLPTPPLGQDMTQFLSGV